MQKRWLVAGLVVLLATAGGGAVFSGLIKLPGSSASTDAMASKGDAKADSKADGKRSDKDKKPEPPLEFVAREVVQPTMARLPTMIEFSGPLVAPSTAIVRAKAGGTLLAMSVVEGSRVKAGQSLGRIDLAELSTRVAERDANTGAARAALTQAERTHASNERLAAQQFISAMALDNSRAAVDTARAQLAAAQASLETTRVSMRDAALVAPISGVVAKRQALPGERVSPEQPLLTIVDLAKLELAGTVGTHEVSRLTPGLPVSVQVEGLDKPVAGRIARLAPAAEPGTRAIGVTIEMSNPNELLRAGQYAVARVTLADDTDRLTLPVSAIGSASGQDHVWVIEGGLLARRSVTLGKRDEREGRVEIKQGLVANSQVLGARFDNLREGAKALVVASKAAPMASAAVSTPVLR